MLNFVLKNLQNKNFWLKLHRTMLQWTFITQSILFILYLLLHMKMKKLLVGAFLWMFAVAWVAILPNYASAQTPEPAGGNDTSSSSWASPQGDKNFLSPEQTLTGSAFLDTLKNAINWIMWILATIALVMCLYGWFKMVTAAGDEKKYQDGLKVLKYAAIWLAIVWLSWMIVSVIFWFVWTLWWGNQTQAWQTTNISSDDGSIYWNSN